MLPTLENLEPRHLCARAPLSAVDPAPAGAFAQEYVKPDASNTGPLGDALAKYTGPYVITKPGTHISGVTFNQQVTVKAPGVVITDFKSNAHGDVYGFDVVSGDLTLTHGTITNAAAAAVAGNGWDCEQLNVHDLGSDAFKGGGHNTLIGCFIHLIGSAPGAHADGIQIDNGDSIVIRGNNFALDWWTEKNGTVYRTNSAIFLNGYVYQYLDGTVIDHNFIGGGNFGIYALTQTNTQVTNNVFDEGSFQFGDTTAAFKTFSGNVTATGVLL